MVYLSLIPLTMRSFGEIFAKLLFAAAVVVFVWGMINSTFDTTLGIRISGSRLELPTTYLVTCLATLALLLILAILIFLANIKTIFNKAKANIPMAMGVVWLVAIAVIVVVTYFSQIVTMVIWADITSYVYDGDLQTLQSILQEGNANEQNLNDALKVAVQEEKTEFIPVLVQAGADVNANDLLYSDYTLLMEAVSSSSFDVIEALVENNADVNAINDEEKNAGMIAISTRAIYLKDTNEDEILKIIQLLIDKGLNIDASGKYGDTLLWNAEYQKYTKVIDYLKSLQ